MLTSRTLEQLFVRPRGAGLELLLVLENAAGARFRETLQLPTRDAFEAVRRAARHLARRGDALDVGRLRLRVERGGSLEDDGALERAFVEAFELNRKAEP